MSAAEKPSSKGQAWFCTTGLPSDIVIEVEDMTFHLHKFPLMSKSRKLHQLITEQEEDPSSATRIQTATTGTKSVATEVQEQQGEEEEEEDEIIEEHCEICLPNFPGGSESFEMAAKFCYGVKIDLSSSNVASLRCAGEYLEMTEEYSEDNLISKTERFLSQYVLKSIKDSIKTLKSCEHLMSLAESLGITQRCIDSIVSRSSSANPALFGWPVNEAAANESTSRSSASKQILWNGIETGGRKGGTRGVTNGDSWFEELALLSLPLFKELIQTMRERDSSSVTSEAEQRELLETIISNLPLEKSSRSSTATRFLFGLLRTANILNASEACRATLEKKIGSQLGEATLDDLLIPSYSYLNETLYDVDCVERILGYFLDGLEERNAAGISGDDGVIRSPALMLVGKLIDGYLSEIASDANLKPEKFCNFAISLPDQARLFDDGLYRAVDVYLKAHPWISEAEREKICGVMDCQKLTLEACTHAAQNERLPLRAVVQVLFFEQLQLRHAVAGTLMASEIAPVAEQGRPSTVLGREEEAVNGSRNTWRATVRENQVLRLDMDSMRTRVHQLERECSSMKKVIEKFDKTGPPGSAGRRVPLTKKLGCKFKTQVCDSHESTVADASKGRHHRPHHE
ncbi:BTB/POZ domain-containing protein family [Quillaja saponaria]|uniref:BTB/POZ domain-containing protein family n=1 Tax=Quillaja saponaria TaxID=32244 RepID=A0AAD7P6X0_QUISA|nr:BTB/POZ domain-containing protein family [Quillaja saponaria]